ncbi:MAG: redoxin domain-containing protein [Phycisphaerales bacterium]|nr:MAG: redoxin domain-containing protein [Phycisphaerales bacterium]
MKRYTSTLIAVLAVLMIAQVAFGQAEEAVRRDRPRYRDMTEAEREKFRAEMAERRKEYEKMSPEEKAKLRAEWQERYGTRARILGREQQLEVVAAIQKQLDKLKAAIESLDPEARRRIRDLSPEEQAKLREKTTAAMRDRVNAARAIEQELAKLRPGGRSPAQDRPGVNELRALHSLAVKENATETAKRIENLIARYQRQAPGRDRPDRPRPQRDRPPRPPRPDRPGQAEAGKRARPFTLQSFDGKTVNLADYRGKTVVLEWVNFECPFVKHHYDKNSTMIDLAKRYKDKGVVWLAINSTNHTTPAANHAFATKHDLPYPILDDRSGEVGRAYDAKTTPHMFVIAPAGRIVYEGAIDNSPLGKTPAGQEKINYVDKVLADIVARRDVSVKNTKPYGCTVKYAK